MKKFLPVLLTFSFLFFAASGYIYLRPYVGYLEEERRLTALLEAEREEAAALENERAFRQSAAYVEAVAREKLGLCYPYEIIFYNIAEK